MSFAAYHAAACWPLGGQLWLRRCQRTYQRRCLARRMASDRDGLGRREGPAPHDRSLRPGQRRVAPPWSVRQACSSMLVGRLKAATETTHRNARPVDTDRPAFSLVRAAEDARFELARGCPQHAFQGCGDPFRRVPVVLPAAGRGLARPWMNGGERRRMRRKLRRGGSRSRRIEVPGSQRTSLSCFPVTPAKVPEHMRVCVVLLGIVSHPNAPQ
jgi:hypothetical protein